MPPTRDWVIHEVQADVRAQIIRQPPSLSVALQAEIDALWDVAQARTGGGLFNGRVFSVDEITPGLLSGHMTEFRRVVAQIERPELHDALRVRSLAVCGTLCCATGVVLGRRPAGAVYQASMWQLPPAGSVDAGALRPDGTLDLQGQLFRELDEELGLQPDDVTELRPFSLVEHPGSHVLDLGFLLRTPLSAAAVVAAHSRGGNDEYQDVEVVPFAALSARIGGLDGDIVPAALVFLGALGLLPEQG